MRALASGVPVRFRKLLMNNSQFWVVVEEWVTTEISVFSRKYSLLRGILSFQHSLQE
jgi:hypothetical protein